MQEHVSPRRVILNVVAQQREVAPQSVSVRTTAIGTWRPTKTVDSCSLLTVQRWVLELCVHNQPPTDTGSTFSHISKAVTLYSSVGTRD